MPARLPVPGDLIRIREPKTWWWYECDCSIWDSITIEDGVGFTSVCFVPYWRRPMKHVVPSEGVMVVDIDGTFVHFMHDHSLYHVRAECTDHILHDFEILSGMDWCQG